MPTFLQIGNTWLNVDHINKIETTAAGDGSIASVKIFMTGGGNHLFAAKDAQQFLDFVREHKIG